MTEERGLAPASQRLSDLAAAANAEHEQATTLIHAGLTHARRAGELLLEAKSLCAHGEWLPWLQANFSASERTAQGYMRVAARWSALEREDPQRVADLSYREALRELSAPVESNAELRVAREFASAGGSLREQLETAVERLEDLAHAPRSASLVVELRDLATWVGDLQNDLAEHQLRAEREVWRLAEDLAAMLNRTARAGDSVSTAAAAGVTAHWVVAHLDHIGMAVDARLQELGAA